MPSKRSRLLHDAQVLEQRREQLMAACTLVLRAIGEDPRREALRETPERFARAWLEFADHTDGSMGTVFTHDSADQMVVVSGMRVWSMCEHHLLPFWCDVAIGYVPHGRVLGLSKFARISHALASRLQTQERLVEEIAAAVAGFAKSDDVAVHAVGEHTCMLMRGVRTPGLMRSSKMLGTFRDNPAARAEFLSMVK